MIKFKDKINLIVFLPIINYLKKINFLHQAIIIINKIIKKLRSI
jgi:hypothetical protein